MNDSECVDAAEIAAALDPSVGDGTPDSAPHLAPFDDDTFDVDEASGAADDDDDISDDDDAPIAAEV